MMDFKGATPSRMKIRDAVAKQVKGDPELTIIKHIYTKYGVEKAKIIAHVYNNKEDMAKYEDKKLLTKHEKKEKPKEEAPTPAEEKKKEAEAPKEEVAEAKTE